MTLTPEAVYAVLSQVRAQQPLTHCITNMVAANTTANVLLALGASPLMAHAPD